MSDPLWQAEPSLEFDDLSRRRIAAVRSLPQGSHVHIIGVCGTGTGSVLQLLKDLGFKVSGSDKNFYPPMGDIVRAQADRVYEGYRAENLEVRPDLVVVGNAVGRSNPEVQRVLDEHIPYASMPEVIAALLVGEREDCSSSIVITGTHGKTTTTAACAWILERGGRAPGYFIGGLANNFSETIRRPSKDLPVNLRVSVLEGDEYDSAFFSKYAKFLSYRADIVVITSLEFDHADIYRSIEEIEEQFLALVKQLPEEGLVIMSDDTAYLRDLAEKWRVNEEIKAQVLQYGTGERCAFRLLERTSWCFQDIPFRLFGQELLLSFNGKPLRVKTTMSGEHNATNLLAAAAVAWKLGVGEEKIDEAVRTFEGVKRRQDVLTDAGGIIVVEDFAHHPSAVAATLSGIRESFRPDRLIAVLEPNSATSRRNYFQNQYTASFGDADVVVVREVHDPGQYSATGEIVALDVPKLTGEIQEKGTLAKHFAEVADIQNFLLSFCTEGDVVVLMSNGSFSGLPQSLSRALEEKYAEE